MSKEKEWYGRIQHKYDIEENWKKAVNFIPLVGELIIYGKDSNYNYDRFKVGDGVTLVNALPFTEEEILKRFNNLAVVATTGLIDDLEIGEDTVLILDGGSVGTDIEINGNEETGQSLQINSNDDSQIKGMDDSEIINELANTDRGITANIV